MTSRVRWEISSLRSESLRMCVVARGYRGIWFAEPHRSNRQDLAKPVLPVPNQAVSGRFPAACPGPHYRL